MMAKIADLLNQIPGALKKQLYAIFFEKYLQELELVRGLLRYITYQTFLSASFSSFFLANDTTSAVHIFKEHSFQQHQVAYIALLQLGLNVVEARDFLSGAR